MDLWWQIKTGEIIWTNHAIPHADIYSHTAQGSPWIVQEWLAEVLFYLLYRWNPLALVVWKVLMVVITFGLVLWICNRASGHLWASAVLVSLAATAASPFFDIRPQLISYLGAAITLSLLLRPDGRHLWLLPPLILLWANLHAGFNLGVFLVFSRAFWGTAARFFGKDREGASLATLWTVSLASLGAGLINPNGYHLYLYPFRLMGHETVMGFIMEWLSPNFHRSYTRPFEALILLSLLCLALSSRPKTPVSLWLLAFFLHASLMFYRNVPLFSLVASVFIAPHLADILERAQSHPLFRQWRLTLPIGSLVAASFLIGGAIGQVRAMPGGDLFDVSVRRSAFPEDACRFLDRSRMPGLMYNEYKWGGYLIWRYYPRRKVFMDGRAEVYFGPAFDAYYRIHNTHTGWQRDLDRYGVNFALVAGGSSPDKAMSASSLWKEVYRDSQAAVFVRAIKAAPTAGS